MRWLRVINGPPNRRRLLSDFQPRTEAATSAWGNLDRQQRDQLVAMLWWARRARDPRNALLIVELGLHVLRYWGLDPYDAADRLAEHRAGATTVALAIERNARVVEASELFSQLPDEVVLPDPEKLQATGTKAEPDEPIWPE